MKKSWSILILAVGLCFTMACSCSLLDRFFTENSGDSGPVVVTQEDGSLAVEPTSAAEGEFAVQTQQAMIDATKQALIDNVEATAQAMRPTDLAVDNVPVETTVPTPRPGLPTVSVSVDTNCRTGPGVGYEAVSYVLAGQSVEVVGVDSTGSYYIVQSPNGGTCWLWSHYATLNGDPNSLTVMTPPEPPIGVTGVDHLDWISIQYNEDFTWDGHWVVGGMDGQIYADWYTNSVFGNHDYFRLESVEIDIIQDGNFLYIELMEVLYWEDGNSAVFVTYGLAEVSEDNTVAAGVWYWEEIVAHTISQNVGDSWSLELPILWYQNGNPNQFIGSSNLYTSCGARAGEAIPVPCTWP